MGSGRFPTALHADRGGRIFLGLLLASAVLVPSLHLSSYTVTLLGKYMTYAMLAIAVDLIWGYCGILSLGHGAFFALGAYAMGMYLMRQIGSRGVYGDPLLPDFMVFLNWKELPWYWHGFDSFPFAVSMVLLVPGLLALAFGYLAFRARVSGVYLSIITQALTYALMLAFFRNDMGFGGNNGFTDFKEILGCSLQAPGTRMALFLTTVVALGGSYVLCRSIIASRAGRVFQAVRDAENRARFIGYRVESYKLWVLCCRPCWRGSPGRCTCRRSASSIRASSRRRTRSKSSFGWQSAVAARCTARWPARFSSTLRRPISLRPCRVCGCMRSVRCSWP
jgi:urea transport system permease protein